MAQIAPSAGGCWFCHTDHEDDKWAFSSEWDAFFHHKCFKRAYQKGNEEAIIIFNNEWDSEEDRAYFETIEV